MKQLVVVVMAIVLGPQAAPYRAEIEKARAARVAELKADDGWLTVTGLLWLKPGKNVAGSAPGSDLMLPAKGPKMLGVFELAGGRVTFAAEPGVTVMSDGAPVRQQVLDTRGGDRTALTIGDLRLFLIRREDRYAIRMRDLNSPMRRGFEGLTYYPLNEALRVDATFTAYAEPRPITIPNVLGQNPEMVSPGVVSFTLNGKAIRLEPVYETDEKKDLFFIFKDPTSQDTTYPAGRFLHTPLPQNGRVLVDFNLAYNPPCAFTDFATCPLPPKQNQMAVRIEAGEKAYHGVTK
ncbi:MAG: DUF1684 domain-containing protein [Vicinamibacterales bacterium]